MKKGDYLTTLLRSDKTVFTSNDIAMLWQDSGSSATRGRLHYYVKNGDLYRIRKGLYAKNSQYSKLELATRILTPAYVSFETVLAKSGLIFQYYKQIFIASYAARELAVDGTQFVFRKIKNTVLVNGLGVNQTEETSIASKERAFLDTLYIHSDYHFDNLRALDWDFVFQILPIYGNMRMTKIINTLYKTK